MNLNTGRVVNQRKFQELPITDAVIRQVESLALAKGHPNIKNGCPIFGWDPENNEDFDHNNNDSDYDDQGEDIDVEEAYDDDHPEDGPILNDNNDFDHEVFDDCHDDKETNENHKEPNNNVEATHEDDDNQ
jgi:hypothetical protein